MGGWTNGLYHWVGTIKNDTTSQEIAGNLWMALASQIKIDCDKQTAIYTEGNMELKVPAALTLTDETEWMDFNPGTNAIVYDEEDMVDTDLTVAHRGRKAA